MKKAVSVFLLFGVLMFCACTPAATTKIPSYYTAQMNRNDVSVAPFLYYADYNRLAYAVLKSSLGDRYAEVVFRATVSDFLTYHVVLNEAGKRALVLTDAEKRMVEDDYQSYLSTRKNEYLSEEEVRQILSVYYLQEQIRNAFTVSEEDIESAFCAEYRRFRYCLVAKYDGKGQKYSAETLDELQKKAYNIYASVCNGLLSMQDAVALFSSEYENAELYTGAEKTEVEMQNRILSEIGFLVDGEGYTDYSEYPIPNAVNEALQNAGMKSYFLAEDDIGWWICEKMDPLPLINEKRDLLLYRLRTKAFSEWLDEKKEAISYTINQQMIDELFRP